MEHLFMPDNTNGESDKLARTIGHDLLGPVIHRWLLALHQYISYFDDGDTKFLFCARAGVRISNLYNIFCQNFDANAPVSSEIFWASRLAVAKGTYKKQGERSAREIAAEYIDQPIHEIIRGMFRHHPDLIAGLDLRRSEYKAHGHNFPGWLFGPTPAAKVMVDYLNDCGVEFDRYIASLTENRKRVVLIDSGWRGSMQTMLADAYPEISWHGLYFGRLPAQSHHAILAEKAIGLLFEGGRYISNKPETAFVQHRHLIETLLEPNGPSIEEVPFGRFLNIAQALINQNINEILDPADDKLYLHVIEYLRVKGQGLSIAEIFSNYHPAMRELARIIVTPSRDEALALRCKDRSADFGKSLMVPVLLPQSTDTDADERIKEALWREGQIALEFDGGFARDLQLRVSGSTDGASYFESYAPTAAKSAARASVAIITRTKNRPVLLRRAAESVAAQTYQNYVWVIVNDGGDETVVQQIIKECRVDRRKIILVSNRCSLGMEAASNAGIRNSHSDLIVIHDDDDSWEPDFLSETVGFLAAKQGSQYAGVITGTTYVSEEIKGDNVKIHERRPYMDWVRTVQLSEMAASNMFAPISFVFRRSIWDAIGGYNERLPVLGDWFFNLEFLLRADIGVISKPLANYHHRDRSEISAYANSLVGGASKHEEFDAIARNEFIRKNAAQFPGAVAIVVAYFASDLRSQSRQIAARINNAKSDVGNSNLVDKYWAVLHINQDIRSSLSLRFKSNALDPNISWIELEKFIRSNKRVFIPVPPDFDEHKYLTQNDDVAAAVRNGALSNGYKHYLTHGRSEGRIRPTKA